MVETFDSYGAAGSEQQEVKVSDRFEDLTLEQQAFMIEFLQQNFIPISTTNLKRNAYGLKQAFSRKYFYVSENQFAQAMKAAGFRVIKSKATGFQFNISEASPYFK